MAVTLVWSKWRRCCPGVVPSRRRNDRFMVSAVPNRQALATYSMAAWGALQETTGCFEVWTRLTSTPPNRPASTGTPTAGQWGGPRAPGRRVHHAVQRDGAEHQATQLPVAPAGDDEEVGPAACSTSTEPACP